MTQLRAIGAAPYTFLERMAPTVQFAQKSFADLLRSAIARGPMTAEHYIRYLSMQYHLTKGVQRYFITAAAHSDLKRKKALRRWLLDFANEEELHYVVAGKDLQKLGHKPLPEPFDVTLWHAYFKEVVVERPFVRLGAACVLENISGGAAKPYVAEAMSAPFFNRDNTNFLVIHQHEKLPHGEQILEALAEAALDDRQINDLIEGARRGLVFYLRMAEWALYPTSTSACVDASVNDVSMRDIQEISEFEMTMLEQSA